MKICEAYPIDSEYKKFIVREEYSEYDPDSHGTGVHESYRIVEMGKDDPDLNEMFWAKLKMGIMKSKTVNSFKFAVDRMLRKSNREYIRNMIFGTADGEIRWATAANLFRGSDM